MTNGMKVRTTGPGWLTPEQAKDPEFRGPVQGEVYPATEHVHWHNGTISKHVVDVVVDGYVWPVWIDKPGDQFAGEVVSDLDPLIEKARAVLADYDTHQPALSIHDQEMREYRLASALRALIESLASERS